MKRRNFLASIAALFAAAVAKVKAGPTEHLAAYGTGTFKPGARVIGIAEEAIAKDSYGWMVAKPWPPGTPLTYTLGKDGLYRWKPIDTE